MLHKFRRGGARDPDEIESIIGNLNHILNTKKSFGHWLPGFGVGDYSAHQAREKVVATVIAEIKENVSRFEPRVRLEKIQEVGTDSPFRMRFEVRCVFLNSARPLYIILDSLQDKVLVED